MEDRIRGERDECKDANVQEGILSGSGRFVIGAWMRVDEMSAGGALELSTGGYARMWTWDRELCLGWYQFYT